MTLSPCDIPGWQAWVVVHACAYREWRPGDEVPAPTPEELAYCKNVQEALIQALPDWALLPPQEEREWVFERTDKAGSWQLQIILPPYRLWLVMVQDRRWSTHVWGPELQAALATCMARRPGTRS